MCYNDKYSEKQLFNQEQIFKIYLSSNCFLKLESMKQELLVIVNQNVTVNIFHS